MTRSKLMAESMRWEKRASDWRGTKTTGQFTRLVVRPWVPGPLLMVLTMLAYAPVWHCGYIWDDNHYITQNTTLHDLHGLWRIWSDLAATPQYYPLVHTTFWLEYHLWGLTPLGYHVVNVALHALAAILLWRVLLRLSLPGAWLAAAIFALHPVEVESVAWVTERKNVLSGVFYFAAALSYLRFQATGRHLVERQRWIYYCSAVALFVCALLSKTVTCSLPAALLLVSWWKAGRVRRQDVLFLLPFFVLGLGFGLLTAWIEQQHVGAQGAAWSFTFFERLLIAGRALWFYGGKLFWPTQLTFIYPRWTISVSQFWQWLFPLGVLAVFAACWLGRARIGRGPLVAVLFFAGTLLPALGFANVYPFRFSFVADHFQYLASVGLISLAAAGLHRLPKVIPVLLLALLGGLTWRQVHVYRDLESLWRDTVRKNPSSWMAQGNLSNVLFAKGELEPGLAHARKAVELDSYNVETQNNMGYALVRLGRVDEAFPYFEKALELEPNRAAAVHYNLGNAYLGAGRPEEAIPHFEKALEIEPTLLPAYNDSAEALALVGRTDEALARLQHALELDPNYSVARHTLANTLLQVGRVDVAMPHLRTLLAANPRDVEALQTMAWVLATWPDASVRDGAKALELAEKANQLGERSDSIMSVTLAAAYAEAGRFAEAIATAEKAQKLATDTGNTALVDVIRRQTALYRSGQPYRDTGTVSH